MPIPLRNPMRAPDGYSFQKTLRASGSREVQLATRDSDQRQVVLKIASDRSDEHDDRLASEAAALRVAAGSGVPALLEVLEEAPALVLEHVPGVSLATWASSRTVSVSDFLELAIALGDILGRIHRERLIHGGINPENVLVDPFTLRTHLIDFGAAHRLGTSSEPLSVAPGHDGLLSPLHFIAPEQTGRMNRGVDMRSDLYSLGAVLHFLATGRTPFPGHDPLTLIHAHLARKPQTVRQVRPDFPEILSQIVAKLLQKEAEDRYQSAPALRSDLAACREQLGRAGALEITFPLGRSEIPDRPQFSRRVHGREAERAALHGAYARAATGSVQALWIRGESGSGKSALVHQLCASLARSGTQLAAGKFDSYRDQAYSVWRAALGSLVQQILVEREDRFVHWQSALRAGLGNVAQAVIDLVPELAHVLGEVPPIPALGPREAQARLSLALQRWIRVCATREHPLLIFLDDLQWSDPGSRVLLEDLLCAQLPAALLIVGAYRSNEVAGDHPLLDFFQRLEQRGIPLEFLDVGGLEPPDALAMLASSLQRPAAEITGLAELIGRRTGNVPMLMQQFVEILHDRGLLRYEPGAGWVGDLEAIAQTAIPDGAVGLMLPRMHRLEPEVRAVLEIASCVGDEFDAELLAMLGAGDRPRTEQRLFALCDAGLIAPCPVGFRFTHDRIREAAQLLRSDDERALLHLGMARMLLERTPQCEQSPRLFEIVEHLNRSLRCQPPELRLTAVRLNLTAAKRLLGSGAVAAARTKLSVARGLLHESDWVEERALGFELFLQAAESAMQDGAFPESLGLLDSLEQHKPSSGEFLQIALKRIQVYAFIHKPEICVRYALGVLRRFGVRWPLRPSWWRAALAVHSVRWMLRGRDPAQVMRPATSIDTEWLSPMLIVSGSGGCLIRFDARLTAIASAFVLRRYLRRGYIARASFTVASYANWLQIILGRSEEARRIAAAAAELNERNPDALYGPRCEMQLHGMVGPWLRERRQALAPLDRVSESALEIGDIEYAYYTRFLKVCYTALAGDPVAHMHRDLRALVERVHRSGHRFPEPDQCELAYRQLLLDPTPEELERAAAQGNALIEANVGWAQPYARTLWLLVLCVYGRYDLAWTQAEASAADVFLSAPFVHVADYTLYRGLAAAELAAGARGAARRHYLRTLRRCRRMLAGWARGGPDFAHMACLLDAEDARLQGGLRRAGNLYERAAKRAAQQKFPHHVALAHERRARWQLALGQWANAKLGLATAGEHYASWGAQAKARALIAERENLAG